MITLKNNISVISEAVTLQVCLPSHLDISREMVRALVSASSHLQLCLGPAHRSLCLSVNRSLCLSPRLGGQERGGREARALRMEAMRLGLGPMGARSPFTGKLPQVREGEVR